MLQPNNVKLPDKIQDQINLAHQKISVLKEDEISLSRSKVDLEKEVARLSITKDSLEAELPALSEKVILEQKNVDSISKEIEVVTEKLNLLQQGCKKAEKDLAKALADTLSEGEKRSEIVSSIRNEQSIIETQKEALEAEIKGFESRKARIKELLELV